MAQLIQNDYKLLCILSMDCYKISNPHYSHYQSHGGPHFRSQTYDVKYILNIYNNGILHLIISKHLSADQGVPTKTDTYYMSTINQDDLIIISLLCNTEVHQPNMNSGIHYEYKDQPAIIQFPSRIPHYTEEKYSDDIMNIIYQTYKIKKYGIFQYYQVVKDENKKIKGYYQYYQDENKKLKEEYEKNKELYKELNQELEEKNTELEEKNTELEETNTELKEELEKLKETNIELEAENKKLKEEYEKNKELDEQLIRSKSAMDQMIVYFKETIELQVIQTNLEIKQIAEIQLKKINSEIINDLIQQNVNLTILLNNK